ncbi:MAG: DUF3667 domain-containing protein [Acidobacteriia bacterium]|nr:DUF3667 domain-containing protein [Terriglobia bacterium]
MAATVQGSATAVKQEESSTCPTCGETITQEFCPACGEHSFDRNTFSFKHFAQHFVHELFEMDSRALRTFRYLLTKPGFVTAEYLAGKRSRYVNPLRLFLFTFALMMLVLLFHSPFDLRPAMAGDQTGVMHRFVAKMAAQKGVSEEVLLDRVNERIVFYYERAELINVLAMTCLLAVLYRKQKWYFAEHAVTALYFLSFTFLLTIVKWPFWMAAGAPIRGFWENLLTLLFLAISLPYLWVTLRKLHGEGKRKTTVKTLVAYGGTQLAIIVTTTISVVLALLQTRFGH